MYKNKYFIRMRKAIIICLNDKYYKHQKNKNPHTQRNLCEVSEA